MVKTTNQVLFGVIWSQPKIFLPVHLLREKLQQCRPSAKNAGVVLFQNEQSNFI
jgi:hypothetical protein